MDRDQIIATLRAMEPELRAQGIEHLALFGSIARGDAGPDSDVDLFATLRRPSALSLFDVFRIRDEIARVLKRPVDLVSGQIRNPARKAAIEKDMAPIF